MIQFTNTQTSDWAGCYKVLPVLSFTCQEVFLDTSRGVSQFLSGVGVGYYFVDIVNPY